MDKYIDLFDSNYDKVIESFVASGKTSYLVALDKLCPLINKFEEQRKLQDKKFYKRLKRDIIDGCLMPPITIAFIDINGRDLSNLENFQNYVHENISNGYILDGMQRLNTLQAAAEELGFDDKRSVYVNVIVAKSQDKLLYRMITLNNGQRPMTPRHQIEILTAEMFDFSILKNISVQTEKARSEQIIKGAFNLGDISKGYLSFLTDNVNNENNKIIDEKMDEILVGRVLDSRESKNDIDFEKILKLIDELCENANCGKWFKVNNNLIGFCVGIKESYIDISNTYPDDFYKSIELFEKGFTAINASKVNLGKYRRQLSCEYIKKYSTLSHMDANGLIEYFTEFTY